MVLPTARSTEAAEMITSNTFPASWGGFQSDDCGVHIVPINDLVDHELNSGCICEPTFDGEIWTHHSLDGREFSEVDYRGPSMSVER